MQSLLLCRRRNNFSKKEKILNMKKFLLFVMLAMGFSMSYAQDCEVIMLPYFGNNVQKLQSYPAEKLAIRCAFARFSFTVADELGDEAYLYDISEVKNRFSGENLPADYKVNLDSLSYYGYNFDWFQGQHPYQTVYFRTPGSEHRYLVLRSMTATSQLVYEWEQKQHSSKK